jgi:hypothetical protein
VSLSHLKNVQSRAQNRYDNLKRASDPPKARLPVSSWSCATTRHGDEGRDGGGPIDLGADQLNHVSATVTHAGGEARQAAKQKTPTMEVVRVVCDSHPARSPNREGVFARAIQAGLLTDGSSYSPTPSQQRVRQWLALLAFVPDHSGAPVRELHPLPVSSTHIASTCQIGPQCRIRGGRCQGLFSSSLSILLIPASFSWWTRMVLYVFKHSRAPGGIDSGYG